MSSTARRFTNDERAHAAFMAGNATEEQLADIADMLLIIFEQQQAHGKR
jgi:hypothetical protein